MYSPLQQKSLAARGTLRPHCAFIYGRPSMAHKDGTATENAKIFRSLSQISVRKPEMIPLDDGEKHKHNLEAWFKLGRREKERRIERENQSFGKKLALVNSTIKYARPIR